MSRYKVVFTPLGWDVVDTIEARPAVAEFCRSEYGAAADKANELNAAEQKSPATLTDKQQKG